MIDRKWERMRWDIVLLVLLRIAKQKKRPVQEVLYWNKLD